MQTFSRRFWFDGDSALSVNVKVNWTSHGKGVDLYDNL